MLTAPSQSLIGFVCGVPLYGRVWHTVWRYVGSRRRTMLRSKP